MKPFPILFILCILSPFVLVGKRATRPKSRAPSCLSTHPKASLRSGRTVAIVAIDSPPSIA